MKKRCKLITIIMSLVFVITSMSGCALTNKGNNMYFVHDGDVLKLNNEEVIADNLDSGYASFAFTSKGNIVFYDGCNNEDISDFYVYNPSEETTRKLNVYQLLDKEFMEEVGIQKISPLWIVFHEDDNTLYFSMYTSSECEYFRIVKIDLVTKEISYTPEIYSFVYDSNNSFAVDTNGNVFYERREEGDVKNIYKYDFELSQESLYISNAKYPKSSSDGKYLFYSSDKGYVIRDLEESKEYSLNYDDFSIAQATFSSSGNSLISVEYAHNPWSLFGSTTIDVRKIDFKTGKSKVIFKIKEDGNKGILYYDN